MKISNEKLAQMIALLGISTSLFLAGCSPDIKPSKKDSISKRVDDRFKDRTTDDEDDEPAYDSGGDYYNNGTTYVPASGSRPSSGIVPGSKQNPTIYNKSNSTSNPKTSGAVSNSTSSPSYSSTRGTTGIGSSAHGVSGSSSGSAS